MSTPKLFDIHTHTQFAAFNEDREAVIQRALDAGVWLINVGTQKDTSAKAVEVAHKYPKGVWATVGLHPIHTESSYHDEKELGIADNELNGFTSKKEDFDYGFYLQLSQDPRVVAIGECGFDFYRLNPGTKRKQKKIFLRHIELAHVSKKPLMIHCRNAFDYLIKILTPNHSLLTSSGIIHFFSGTKSDAQKLLDLGFSFSFGGVTTFTRDYDEVIKYIPLDRLLLETDAPYVAPMPYRGKRNEPIFIIETARRIAKIKGVDVENIQDVTNKNAMALFQISV